MNEWEYPRLGSDVAVAPRMIEEVGDDILAELCSTMWRGDSQTCGSSIGSGTVSLSAYVWPKSAAAVSLHHLLCREPDWDDGGGGKVVVRQHNVSNPYLTYVYRGYSQDALPAIVLNPALEEGYLAYLDTDGWQVSTIARFRVAFDMLPGAPELGFRGGGDLVVNRLPAPVPVAVTGDQAAPVLNITVTASGNARVIVAGVDVRVDG